MEIDLDGLSEEELVELNHEIVARLQFLSRARTQRQMLRFRPGEQVCFHPEGLPVVRGTVTRCNTKTVTVIAKDGRRWKVSPSLLSKVVEGEASGPDDFNVIELHPKRG